MKFRGIEDLTDIINTELGTFCDKFQYKRKELFGLASIGKRGILFKFSDKTRNWVINAGGGTELQYHLFLRDNLIGYGLGFNTQYVPHKNKRTTFEYMQPYANSFLAKSKIQADLTKNGFHYIYGEKSELIKLEHNKYILLGKELSINFGDDFFEIDDKLLNILITDIKGILFDSYVQIVSSIIHNKELILFKPKQVTPRKVSEITPVKRKKEEVDLSKLKINPHKIDYLEKHKKAMEIGDLAEKIVLDSEFNFLEKSNPELAEKVCSVANNTKLGFDILSFERHGEQKQIEVKAISKKNDKHSFIITENELLKSEMYSNYYIYCVINVFSNKPEILRIKNPDLKNNKEFTLKPLTYNVTFE